MKFSDDCYYQLKQAGHVYVDDYFIQSIDMSVDNKIFRRDLIEKMQLKFPEGLMFEDSYFVIAYAASSRSCYLVNERLYRYTRRKDSIMTGTIANKSGRDFAIDNISIFIALHDYFEKHDLLKVYNDLFWSLFSLYAGSAHKWAKSKESRTEIRAKISEFVSKNADEIKTCDPAVQKAVAHVNSSFFFSTPYRAFFWLRGKFRGALLRVYHRFGKISTSQGWTLTKLRDLNLRVAATRAGVTHFRREQRAKER